MSFFKKQNLKIFFLAFALLFSAIPFFASAQTVSDLNCSNPPQGVSEKECNRCKSFYSIFSAPNMEIAKNRESEIQAGYNFVDKLPVICSAQQLMLRGVNMGLMFAGGVAVLFIVFGGYLYITAAGNDEQAEKGRKVLTNSIIGLVVIIMSSAIIAIVVNTIAKPAENNSGGSSTKTTSNTTTQTTNKYSDADAKAAFKVYIPDTVVAGQDFNVEARVNATSQSTVEAAMQLCDGVALTQCPFKVEINGVPQNQAVFSKSNIDSQFVATVPISGFDSAGTLSVVVGVNNTELTRGQITVTAASVNPRGEQDSALLQQAISNSSFSLMTSDGNFSVFVSASKQSVTTLCAKESSPQVKIQLYKNNSDSSVEHSYPASSLNSSGASTAVESKIPVTDYDSNRVNVFLCGYKLNQQ